MAEGTAAFEGWAIIELMGHRKLAGKVSEAVQYGGSMMRIDIFPGEAKEPVATQFYGVSSLYCLTPASEDLCRRFALRCIPEPVARYELPAPPTTTIREDCDDEDDHRYCEDADREF